MALDAQWSAVARGYRFALILAVVVGAAAVVAAALAGSPLAGLFVCAGLVLGGWNSRKLWSDTEKLADGTLKAGDRVRGPALASSARRLGLVTLIAFLVALAYRPIGWTVFVGLLAFQLVMIALVAPALRHVIRTSALDVSPPAQRVESPR